MTFDLSILDGQQVLDALQASGACGRGIDQDFGVLSFLLLWSSYGTTLVKGFLIMII